jgi:hypothetical protein
MSPDLQTMLAEYRSGLEAELALLRGYSTPERPPASSDECH